MPYTNITLEELAKHIGMDARDVRKMADKGELPGQMVGGQWRFNRARLLDWLQHHLHFLDERHLHNLEAAMGDAPAEPAVTPLIAPEAIELLLPARSKPSVLRELVRVAERTGLVYDPDGLIEALEDREAQGATALPGGFAFPHPRRPDQYLTAEPLIAIGRVPAGAPFGAPDGRLTDLFVLLVSQEERPHLHALARLSMLFSTDLPAVLRDAEDPAEALAAIEATEATLLAKRK